MAAEGKRVWEPTPDDPALIIIADEYAELPDEAQNPPTPVARRGRAVAVNLIAATQRPTQAAMGKNTAVRSQMDIRICLRVREPRDADLILGQGSVNSGWHAHKLTKPGEFLISSPEHAMPERNRAYLLTDARGITTPPTAHRSGHPQTPNRQARRRPTQNRRRRPPSVRLVAMATPGPTRRCGTRWWTPAPRGSRSRSWKPRAAWAAAGSTTGSRRTPRPAGPSRSGAATGARPGRLTARPGTAGPRPAPHPADPRAGHAGTPRPVTVSNRSSFVHGPRAYTCRAHTRRGRGRGRSRTVAGHARTEGR